MTNQRWFTLLVISQSGPLLRLKTCLTEFLVLIWGACPASAEAAGVRADQVGVDLQGAAAVAVLVAVIAQ